MPDRTLLLRFSNDRTTGQKPALLIRNIALNKPKSTIVNLHNSDFSE
ncbi:hypothetical protein [Candidatus Puniceispirillum marinum]|nr:hypothetical protein [Candidatus Puniceispirillum marinum]